jgi:signal transduction histidine kinase
LERSVFDLGELCREVVAEARQLARRRVEVFAEGTFRGSWDRNRLHRVIENLVSNALKYSSGDVRVFLGSEGDCVRVRVSDEGEGIPSHERETVFEWFARGSSSAGIGGTGIGLASSRRIAELHGGSLILAEGSGRGATFVLELPGG